MEKSKTELLADLFKAYFDTRKHKRNTRSQLAFEFDFEHHLIDLCDQIAARTYYPKPAICFITNVPVKREIFASPFAHRVVCRLLYNYIAPLFEARMIYDSYSCREGKGTSEGIERIEHHLRSCTLNYTRTVYVLKLDLRGYFMSIDKAILYRVLMEGLDRNWNKRSADGRRWDERLDRNLVDYLIKVILFRNPVKDCIQLGKMSDWNGLPASKSLFNAPKNVGLAIGDITSQLFSNIFLDRFDQYVKRELRCEHYGRYVDDFYVIHASRGYLASLIGGMKSFLERELHLTLHPNKIVLRPYYYGVPFLGAFVKPHCRYVSKSSVKRFHRKMTSLERECRADKVPYLRLLEMRAVLNSYCGFFSHFQAYKMLRKQFGNSPLRKYFDFSADYRKAVLKKRFVRQWGLRLQEEG